MLPSLVTALRISEFWGVRGEEEGLLAGEAEEVLGRGEERVEGRGHEGPHWRTLIVLLANVKEEEK